MQKWDGAALVINRRLSRDGSIACASCHDPERAFSDGRPIALGVTGRESRRAAPWIVPSVAPYRPFQRRPLYLMQSRTV
jgi:cytochrome c peroxidase